MGEAPKAYGLKEWWSAASIWARAAVIAAVVFVVVVLIWLIMLLQADAVKDRQIQECVERGLSRGLCETMWTLSEN